MHILSHLIIMHGNQAGDCLIDCVHLNQSHLSIFLEKFEIPALAILAEQVTQLLLLHACRYIR